MSDVTFDLARKRHGGPPVERRAVAGDAGRHRRGDADRRAAEARARRTSATRTFCFTYGDGVVDVDIGELIAFHREQGTLATVTAVQPPGRFGALEIDGDRVTRLRGEAARRRRLDQRRLLRAVAARSADYIDGDDTDLGARAAGAARARGPAVAPSGTTASGSRWTRCATRTLARGAVGRRAGRPGRVLGVTASGFWRGRRVLVTGHTGFKGSWLALWLHGLGAEVDGLLARRRRRREPVACSSWRGVGEARALARRRRRATWARSQRVRRRRRRPEVVFHLAAQPLVRRSYADPVETFETNVLGTVERARGGAAARRACARSSSSPPTRSTRTASGERGYREDDPLGGHDPYSNSKACAELVTAAYRAVVLRSGAATRRSRRARAGNVIGGGDWGEDRLVPDLVRGRAGGGARCAIRNPDADPALAARAEPAQRLPGAGASACDESREFAEGMELRPGRRRRAAGAAGSPSALRELWGERARAGSRTPASIRTRRSYLRLDSAKAHDRLGWPPGWNLDRALESIVAWHGGARRRGPARADAGADRAVPAQPVGVGAGGGWVALRRLARGRPA